MVDTVFLACGLDEVACGLLELNNFITCTHTLTHTHSHTHTHTTSNEPLPPPILQVLSGDSMVIRGQVRNGPPPERTLALSGITTPKLARRANPNVEGSVDSKDEVMHCLY